MRDYGSAAIHLAYIAAGRLDGYWALTLSPWDVAAGALLISEAGGVLSRFDGSKHDILTAGNLVASNGLVHEELVQDLGK